MFSHTDRQANGREQNKFWLDTSVYAFSGFRNVLAFELLYGGRVITILVGRVAETRRLPSRCNFSARKAIQHVFRRTQACMQDMSLRIAPVAVTGGR